MKQTLGSPNCIEVLLHHHCSPTPHPRRHALAVQQAESWLIERGAIDLSLEGSKTTDKGRAWVEALCQVPAPRQAWVDGNGAVLWLEGLHFGEEGGEAC